MYNVGADGSDPVHPDSPDTSKRMSWVSDRPKRLSRGVISPSKFINLTSVYKQVFAFIMSYRKRKFACNLIYKSNRISVFLSSTDRFPPKRLNWLHLDFQGSFLVDENLQKIVEINYTLFVNFTFGSKFQT